MILGLIYILTARINPMKRHVGMGPTPQVMKLVSTWLWMRVTSRKILTVRPTTNILVLK